MEEGEFAEKLAPLPVIRAFWMSPLLARSISLESTFLINNYVEMEDNISMCASICNMETNNNSQVNGRRQLDE